MTAETLFTEKPSDRTTTGHLLERLRRHYLKPGPMPGGVFVPECGINGGSQSRVDALYVGFTSTSGRILIGHELKVSRADWRKELDSAGKADLWADNCHAWYIVAPSTEIVPVEELPHGWGLMIPNARTSTRMDVKVKAIVHQDRTPSWTVTRSILARLDTLRAQHDVRVQQEASDKARADAEKQLAARRQTAGEPITAAQLQRLEVLERLEGVLGTEIQSWTFDDEAAVSVEVAAAALKLARDTRAMGVLNRDEYQARHLERAARQLLEGLETFETSRVALAELIGGRR